MFTGIAVVGCWVVGKGVIAFVVAELGLAVVAGIVGNDVGRGVVGALVSTPKRLPEGVLGDITGATVSCNDGVSVQASKSYASDSSCTPTSPKALGFSALK